MNGTGIASIAGPRLINGYLNGIAPRITR